MFIDTPNYIILYYCFCGLFFLFIKIIETTIGNKLLQNIHNIESMDSSIILSVSQQSNS